MNEIDAWITSLYSGQMLSENQERQSWMEMCEMWEDCTKKV